MIKYDKTAKEKFVTGLTGSSVGDVNSVSLAMPLSILLWSVLQSRNRTFTPYTPIATFVDFILNCGATLGAITVYSSSTWLFNLLLILPAVFTLLTSQPASTRPIVPRLPTKDAVKPPHDPLPVKPFITNYRGAMMMITCISILAVDFQVFPRRFGKVENWGTSLMDMGVGSFVFTMGVVSVRAFLKTQAGKRLPLSKQLVGSARHSIPLLVLGVIRLLSVKGLDYAEHVTEYGVHWNFFFTLGFLPPFVTLLQSLFDFVPSYAFLSFILAAAYEAALDRTDLGKYILTAPRTDLLSQNREGVFSFFGYLAIYLAGQSLGTFALPREHQPPKDTSSFARFKNSVLGKILIAGALWTILFYWSIGYWYGLGLRLSVSRRLANLPYFLWVSAFNSVHIGICCAIERLCFPNVYKATSKEEETRRARDATSSILFAFNRNGLVVFLVSNLLTGLVNMTLPTLTMGLLESMTVLVGYVALLAAIALGLDRMDVSIKL